MNFFIAAVVCVSRFLIENGKKGHNYFLRVREFMSGNKCGRVILRSARDVFIRLDTLQHFMWCLVVG